jgi:transposase
MDVHKDSVVACVRLSKSSGDAQQIVRTFQTTTAALFELGDWLAEQGVTIVAMESTGVYWKPIWNLLEDRLKLMLVNARDVKQVPGRKTDVTDCQWLAQLLSAGLLKASFIPDRPHRQLRDLTRQRMQLMHDLTRVANRIQKVLEDANIKLASVASDVLGKSGRAMIQALIDGTKTPEEMADLALYRMRAKLPQLRLALNGRVDEHHRFMLQMALDQVEQLEHQVELFDRRIDQVMSPLAKEAVQRLDDIPGIDRRAGEIIVAEIGWDMSRFPTSGHLSTWAGVSPGNNQSAGKRRKSRVNDGNRWLKATLMQCAWAASRCRNSYFRLQHKRLAHRRGAKRATMAVAHSQLCVAYELLKGKRAYQDLGVDYFDRHNEEGLKRYLLRRLDRLGYEVTLKTKAA